MNDTSASTRPAPRLRVVEFPEALRRRIAAYLARIG